MAKNIKVRFLKSPVSFAKLGYQVGQIGEVAEDIAKRLLEHDYATLELEERVAADTGSKNKTSAVKATGRKKAKPAGKTE